MFNKAPNTLVLLFLTVLFAFTAPAKEKNASRLVEAKPESAGMSAERLARIDDLCKKAVADGDIPGVVALVARRGHVVYYKAFGMADNDSGRQLKRDDIFRIASQTKAITATAVMMLWEQGKFRLDDPISRYIPQFKNPQVLKTYESETNYTTEAAKSEITIRELLDHTSGIGYGAIDADERFKALYRHAAIIDAFTTEPVTLAQNEKRLAKLPLHHNPGEHFTYSEGLDVLAYLVEVISGEPFDRFLREHLFAPMGMNDTWFYLPQQSAQRLVAVQVKTDGRWVHKSDTFYDPDYPIKGARTFFSGGGGLSSTAWDYATFLQMYLNQGELNGHRLLSRTTVNTILSNQIGDLMGKNAQQYYGLAFGVVTPEGAAKGGQGSAGTFQWGGYFNTQYFADPHEKIIGVLMKQTLDTKDDRTADLFRQLVFQAIND